MRELAKIRLSREKQTEKMFQVQSWPTNFRLGPGGCRHLTQPTISLDAKFLALHARQACTNVIFGMGFRLSASAWMYVKFLNYQVVNRSASREMHRKVSKITTAWV